MNNIEKRLMEEKKRIDAITAPEELEDRLRSALNSTSPSRTKRITPMWKLAVIALFFIVVVGYQYNALAFYGKKLLGFDEVIHGTLKELNDQGMGQIVEKKVELEDGTDLIINGIMTDANQLVMYYTLTNPNGIVDDVGELFNPSRITSFLTNSHKESGSYVINEDHTEVKGTMSFEPVNPFSKKLTIHLWQNEQDNQVIEESISIPYNPNKAMQTEIKQSIKKTLQVDKGKITFKSIIATPTMTKIEGSLNVENFDRVNLSLYGIELIANGVPIKITGSSAQSSLRGRTFDIRYDALPEKLTSLELVMKEFAGYQMLEERISLSSIDYKQMKLAGKEVWVKDVSTTSQGVEITIATDDDVMLDGVSLESKDKLIPLKTTVNENYISQEDGREMKERTLLFDTKIEPEYLVIEGMHYMKAYNNVINIPLD